MTSKYWAHPTFNVNQEVRNAPGEQILHELKAAAAARLGHAAVVAAEQRSDHHAAGQVYAITDPQSPRRWLAMGTINDTVYRDGSRRSAGLNPEQIKRLLKGDVPIRWYGGNWNKVGTGKASQAPITNSQAQTLLWAEDPRWDLYFCGWRKPESQGLVELGVYDVDVLRELVQGYGEDVVFPPSSASSNPDGSVKRYFNPFHLQKLFGVELVWAASFTYPGQRWREEMVTAAEFAKKRPIRSPKQRRHKLPEPSPEGLFSRAGERLESDGDPSDG